MTATLIAMAVMLALIALEVPIAVAMFAAGSVGCVTGISRVIDIGTEGAPNYLLSWTSAVLPNVPVGSLPNEAVNGFEYTHNFANKDAYAVFRVSKSVLTDINSAQVCHVNRHGAVDCQTPAVTEEDQQWVLKRAISESRASAPVLLARISVMTSSM